METQNFSLLSLDLDWYPRSLALNRNIEFGLAQVDGFPRLAVLAGTGDPAWQEFEGETSTAAERTFLLGPTSARNAAGLRTLLPWLRPALRGLRTSAGLGDRLGLATPGHIRAVRATGGNIAPIFAQQSMRENARTGRTPQQVQDEALWGIFQEGWRDGFGADADHLKTSEDIDLCLEAGYTFYTIDPGAFVDPRAETASASELGELAAELPEELQVRANGLLNQSFDLEGLSVHFDQHTLLKAMVKYGRSVWHVVQMYRHLEAKAAGRPFELEVSVDETEQPTSHAEHVYIASELHRLGVAWVSLAPRFSGAFEKGVDYIGDLEAFEANIAGHAAVARQFGPYKLSLHSGSDKFSIYPAAARQTGGLVHLKTAGTSYLEALRTIAGLDSGLFREIYAFARERYETDRVSYHVSAQLVRAPLPEGVSDWQAVLDQFDARQILHVTFGSVLKERLPGGKTRFFERMMGLLQSNGEAYADNLERHFIRHLSPFAQIVNRPSMMK